MVEQFLRYGEKHGDGPFLRPPPVGPNRVNSIKPGLFSRLPGRGGGGGLRGPDAKNQPIEMKLGMSHYGHKIIPNAKFESGSSFSFGDMTSQNFPQKKRSHQIQLFTPG